MPPRFDPDTALKSNLIVRYKKLAKSHDSLKKAAANAEAELQGEIDKLRTRARAAPKAKKPVAPAVPARDREIEGEIARLRTEAAQRESELQELRQAVAALTGSAVPHTFCRVELRAGMRSRDPDLHLYLDLIIDGASRKWLGGRAVGYARMAGGSELYPVILDKERLDYGSGYEDDRDGRLMLSDRPIETGATVPFFPDGAIDAEGKEVFIVGRVTPMLQGRHT